VGCTVSDLERLIARLEKAAEGSTELDTDICCALYDIDPELGRRWNEHFDPGWQGGTLDTRFLTYWRSFTRNLDAALTLVPDVGDWTITQRTRHPYQGKWLFEATVWDARSQGFAPSAPLAVCIAALRARIVS